MGFRWFVRVSGRRLQLSGWVKNRPDGSVEVAAAGSEDRLLELRKLIMKGPDGAEVSDVLDFGDVCGDLAYPFAMKK